MNFSFKTYKVPSYRTGKIKTKGTAKWLTTMIVLILTFIPTYIGVGGYLLIDPPGFWEQFATVALALVVLGPIQIWFLIGAVGLLLEVVWK